MRALPANARSTWIRLGLTLSTVVVYVLVFTPLYQLGWDGVAVLLILPVTLAAWFFGLRVGIIASLLAFPLNSLLLNSVGQSGWNVVIRSGNVTGSVALVLVAVAIGRLSDLQKRLNEGFPLRETEEKLRLLSEQSIVGVSVIQGNQIKYVNQAVADINGYTVAEMMNWDAVNFGKLIHPDDLAFAVEQLNKKQRGDPDAVAHYSYRLITKQQETRFVDQYSKTISYNGRPADLIILIDISDRKRAEDALSKVEKRYRELVENSLGLIWTHTLDGTLLSVNPAAAHALGYQPAEVIGKNLRDLVVPSVQHLFSGYLENIRQQQIAIGHVSIMTKEGEERVWAYRNVFYEELGAPPYVIGHAQDITEQERSQQQLQSSEKRLRLLLEQAPAVLWTTDTELRITSCTGAGLAALHMDQTQLVGVTVNEYIRTEDPMFLPIAAHRRALEGQAETYEQVWGGNAFQCYVEPLHDQAGHIVGCIGLAVDVTERKQAEKQNLEFALERNRVELLRTFIRDMSHDLKTPLTTIETSLYLLERLADPEKRKVKLDGIKAQILHLETLIQEILAVSRLDNAPDLSIGQIDLNGLIRDIEERFRPEAESKEIVVNLPLGDLPLIPADGEALSRALVNLVQNALHYTPSGGTVTIQTDMRGDNVVVEVRDTGIGISATDLPHIFEHFYRADEARATDKGGTGLGLAIVKKVIDLHGGSIDVESTPGQGSTFRVWLPIVQEGTNSGVAHM